MDSTINLRTKNSSTARSNARKGKMIHKTTLSTRILIAIAVIAVSGIAWAGEGTEESSSKSSLFSKVDIHGYVSQGYLYSTDNNYVFTETSDGSFQFNEAAINVYTDITDKLSVAIQLFARDLGAVGNNAIVLDYAFGDYHFSDAFGIRAGRVRTPWGLYGETRDVDMARTSIFMPQCIYAETQREVAYSTNGFGIYGILPVGFLGDVEYIAQIGSNTVDDQNTPIGWIGFGNEWTEPNWRSNLGTNVNGRLIWNTPLEGLRVGTSIYQLLTETVLSSKTTNADVLVNVWGIPAGTPYTLTLRDTQWWISFAEFSAGNLLVAAEYVRFENSSTDSIWEEAFGISDSKNQGDGYYLSATYRFTDLFELGTYYSRYWPNRNDRKGENNAAYGWPDHRAWSDDLALSLRFDVHKGFIWKLEGHYMDGTANLTANFNDIPNSEKNAFLLATKVSFTF